MKPTSDEEFKDLLEKANSTIEEAQQNPVTQTLVTLDGYSWAENRASRAMHNLNNIDQHHPEPTVIMYEGVRGYTVTRSEYEKIKADRQQRALDSCPRCTEEFSKPAKLSRYEMLGIGAAVGFALGLATAFSIASGGRNDDQPAPVQHAGTSPSP